MWDLDGTLVDSSELHYRSWCEALADEGVTITKEQFRATFGQRNDAILGGWLGNRATEERIQRIGDAKEEAYRRTVRDEGISPLAGAIELVRGLRDAGWRQAIASSAPSLNVEVVIDALGLDPYLHAWVAAEDVTHGKPAPDVFLAAAKRVDTPVGRCVAVEDARAGIEAARRAGMCSIGVGPSGFAPADVVVPSLDALTLEVFGRLIARHLLGELVETTGDYLGG